MKLLGRCRHGYTDINIKLCPECPKSINKEKNKRKDIEYGTSLIVRMMPDNHKVCPSCFRLMASGPICKRCTASYNNRVRRLKND